jgi:hypothetical protein
MKGPERARRHVPEELPQDMGSEWRKALAERGRTWSWPLDLPTALESVRCRDLNLGSQKRIVHYRTDVADGTASCKRVVDRAIAESRRHPMS